MPSVRRRPVSSGPARSVAPFAAVAGVVGACGVGWFGFPALPVVWAGLLVGSWVEKPAALTGKKDAAGNATPASPAEERRLRFYRFWRDVRIRLVVPNGDWLPGWPVFGSWLAAVVAAGIGALVPVGDFPSFPAGDIRACNAVAAFVVVAQLPASLRRRSATPGTRVDALAALFRSATPVAITMVGFGLLAGGVAAGVVSRLMAAHPTLPLPQHRLLLVGGADGWLVWPALLAGGALLFLAPAWHRQALAAWKELKDATAAWTPRWLSLKFDPAPRLVGHRKVGPAIVDTFDAPGHLGAMTFWAAGPRIAPTLGAGMRIAVLETPDESPGGPSPGTRHPLRFDVITWPVAELPDLADPGTAPEVARLFAHSAMVWSLEPRGYGRPVPLDVVAITADESPRRVWRSIWAWPGGPTLTEVRPWVGDISARFGCPTLIDHRGDDGGAVYFGAIGDDTAVYADDGPGWAKKLADLAEEDRWREIWAAVLKAGVQQPTIHHGTYAERTLADGTLVHRQPFIVRTGEDPTWFFGTEAKIATALGSKPFVAITGWPVNSARPGERHPQAFSVFWSDQAPPASPDRLPPAPAAHWVLAGQLNRAFAAAKLERPEIASARALSEPDEASHLWEVRLRLYGGVTLATVRQQAERLRQTLGLPYLRVGDDPDGVILYVGAEPAGLRLAQPGADRVRLIGLDWEQAWADAKVISPAGLLPELVGTGRLPHNAAVEVLDFMLPSGLDRTQVRAALAKLRTSTGNEFVEVRDSPDGAGAVRLLASPSNPLPEKVSLDFDEVDRLLSQGIPFATGIEGEPVVFSPLESAHLLLAGVTGSGKSSMAQVLLYGFAILGARVVVVDPQKSGADFRFIEPYADAFASTPHEAAAALKTIYAEVVRRKELNARHGVGFYLDLPDDVRPEPVVLMVDEFTSLMGQSPVPKTTDDPEFESQREELIADNQARAEVGILVGKLAREARSSGLTLLLGTQKLSAKMLDAIPGGQGDVKDLTLDTMLPVPVSDKFPNGWARNEELEIGDHLYAADGTAVPIIGFSEVLTDNELYAVTFDDGQVVKAGANHLWKASSAMARRTPPKPRAYRTNNGARRSKARRIEDLLNTIEVGTLASAADLASLTDMSKTTVLRLADSFGLDRFLLGPGGTIRPYDRRFRRGVSARLWSVDHAVPILIRSFHAASALLTRYEGQWMTARAIAERLYGRQVDPTTAGNVGERLRAAGCPFKETSHGLFLYESTEFLKMTVDHLRSVPARGPRQIRDRVEQVVATAEMAATAKYKGGTNWAVRPTRPLDGPNVELPVDPYALGVWLGDGMVGSGNIVSSGAQACIDEHGLSDQQHIINELASAGYDPHPLACDDILIGTYGLRVKLREAGVFREKHIPPRYLRASFKQRLALLQGLMDTDGSTMNSGTCSLSQTNRRLARNALELVRSFGIKASMCFSDASYRPDGSEVRKVTGTVHNIHFSTGLPVFRLPRKLKKQGLPSARHLGWRYVRSIERIPPQSTRCIAVAHPEHLFLVEGFLPTHNTNLARILLGKASSGDRMSALRAVDDAPVLTGDIPKGRGLWEPLTSSAVAVQCWYAPQPELAAQLTKRRRPLGDSNTHDLRVCQPGRGGPLGTGPTRTRVDRDGSSSNPADVDVANHQGAPAREVDSWGGNVAPRADSPADPTLFADDWGDPLDWGSPPVAPIASSTASSDDNWPVFDAHPDRAVSPNVADHATTQDRIEAEW